MKIGELATRTGVSAKTIRYYEDIGVLPAPERAANGYRAYREAAADRIKFIKDAQAAGMSLVEIQVILELRDSGQSTCQHTIGILEDHLRDVDRQLDELYRTRSRLEALITNAKAMDPSQCTNPNQCQTISKQN